MERSNSLPRTARIAFSILLLTLYLSAFLVPGLATLELLRGLTWFQLFPSFLRTVVAGGGMAAAGFLPVLLLTLLFGRIYCSGLCPFGTLQDGVIRLSPKRRRFRFSYRKPLTIPRYGFLLLLIITALAGSMVLVNVTEPYSLFARSARDIVKPLLTLGSQGLFYLLKPMDIFIAPSNFPVEFWVSLLSLLSVSLIFLFAYRNGRIFCNTLCPVGSVLSIFSRFSLFRININKETCTGCMRCERGCKAECIDVAAGWVDNSRCIRCFNCLSRCRDKAITIVPALPFHRRRPRKVKAQEPATGEINRRQFLQRFTGLGACSFFPVSFLFRKRATGPDGLENTPASPPGSGSIDAFTSRCVACHLCVSLCPTKVLQPSLMEYGLSGIMQPVMDYSSGFCENECTICSRICPSGAISPLTVEEKTRTQIGTSRFIRDRCVVFTQGTACGACAEVCPTQAVYMVPYEGTLFQPETDNSICIGCGNCEFSCPVENGKAIYVVGNRVHKKIEERPRLDEDPSARPEKGKAVESGGKDGFAF